MLDIVAAKQQAERGFIMGMGAHDGVRGIVANGAGAGRDHG